MCQCLCGLLLVRGPRPGQWLYCRLLLQDRAKSVEPNKDEDQIIIIIMGPKLMDVNCTCFIDVRQFNNKLRENCKNMLPEVEERGKL